MPGAKSVVRKARTLPVRFMSSFSTYSRASAGRLTTTVAWFGDTVASDACGGGPYGIGFGVFNGGAGFITLPCGIIGMEYGVESIIGIVPNVFMGIAPYVFIGMEAYMFIGTS